jgi:hypothetical protein
MQNSALAVRLRWLLEAGQPAPAIHLEVLPRFGDLKNLLKQVASGKHVRLARAKTSGNVLDSIP